MYRGLIITGTSGSGKSTVAEALCRIDRRFVHARAVTTRVRRDDDRGHYDHLSHEEFERLSNAGLLLIESEYRAHRYGVAHSVVDHLLSFGKIPLLTITPRSAAELAYGSLISPHERFMTVFLDAPDSDLDLRLGGRDKVALDHLASAQRAEDRRYRDVMSHQLVNTYLERTIESIRALWNSAV